MFDINILLYMSFGLIALTLISFIGIVMHLNREWKNKSPVEKFIINNLEVLSQEIYEFHNKTGLIDKDSKFRELIFLYQGYMRHEKGAELEYSVCMNNAERLVVDECLRRCSKIR